MLATIVAAIAVAAAPVSHHMPTELPAATSIAAGDGWFAWSVPDDPRAPRAYGLAAAHGGRVVRLPVLPRRRPFDVALGADARGDTVAVYSRCLRTAPPQRRFEPRAVTPPGAGCDIWAYDFTTRREAPVPGASRPGVDEYEPALDRGTLVYATPVRGGSVALVRQHLTGGRRRAVRLGLDDDDFGAQARITGTAVRGDLALVTAENGSALNALTLAVRGLRVDEIDGAGRGEECDGIPTDPSIGPDLTLRWLYLGNCKPTTLRVAHLATKRIGTVLPYATQAYARDGTRDLTLVCPQPRRRRPCAVTPVTAPPQPLSQPDDMSHGHGGDAPIDVGGD